MRRTTLHVPTVLLVALVTASTVALTATTTWAAAGPVEVALTASGASPSSVTVEVGQEVVVVNRDDERHRLRAREPEDVETDDLEPGASASLALQQTGTYRFVDERTEDPAFGLTVEVVAAGSSGSGGSTGGGSGGGSSGGSTGGGSGSADAPATATVDIPDRVFRPANVTIRVGGTVTWRNSDGSHTVTAVDRSFDSGIFDSGTWSRRFDAPGVYDYLCLLHPEMRGSVTVQGEGATGGTGAAPPPPSAGGPEPGGSSGGTTTGGGTTGGGTTTGGSSSPTASATGSGPVALTIDVLDFSYDPGGVEVPVGSTITWRNRGSAPHTVTGGGLDSGTLMAGDTFRRTLDSVGTIAYTCVFHPEMRGTVRVVAAAAARGARTIAPPAGSTDAPGPADSEDGPQGQTSATDAATPPGPVVVQAGDLAFSPASVEVMTGTTVTWELTDAAPHTVTAEDGSFDSGILDPGATYEHTFTAPGTFRYDCLVHPGMTGTVVVTEGGTGVVGSGGVDDADPGGAGAATAASRSSGDDAEAANASGGLPVPTALMLIAMAGVLGVFVDRVVL